MWWVIERSLGWNSIEVIQVSFVNPLGIATHVHSTRPSAGKWKTGAITMTSGLIFQPPSRHRNNSGGTLPFPPPAPPPPPLTHTPHSPCFYLPCAGAKHLT